MSKVTRLSPTPHFFVTPCIIDVYMLERTYDNLYRIWLQDGGTKPIPSTADQLRISYAGILNPKKSLSDQLIYHPVKYKILFGTNADEKLQATFKVVKNPKTNVENDIKLEGLTAFFG